MGRPGAWLDPNAVFRNEYGLKKWGKKIIIIIIIVKRTRTRFCGTSAKLEGRRDDVMIVVVIAVIVVAIAKCIINYTAAYVTKATVGGIDCGGGGGETLLYNMTPLVRYSVRRRIFS